MAETATSGRLCACGCGEETLRRRYSSTRKGWKKGDPQRFVNGHNMRGAHRGEENPQWRGEDAGYFALHKWVNRNFTKTGACENCGEEKRTEWASINHVYTRNRRDWLELCRSCHWRMDGRIQNIVGGKLRFGKESY